MENSKKIESVETVYTLTNTTRNGIQQVLTPVGWRSREVIYLQSLEKSTFSFEDAHAKKAELNKDLRDGCKCIVNIG